jgi:next to BRCA1 gene 1 protein
VAVPASIRQRLAPGRGVKHNAICDGCNKNISGVRHKCLDCPDWDYCDDCHANAGFVHPTHRFVAICEPIKEVPRSRAFRFVHAGIYCDGPVCASTNACKRDIVGDRYKCAVCHDLDFCATCEASPANTHNKTHPLIKFKSPVRHVSVTTTGERGDGTSIPTMGDRIPIPVRSQSRATETVSPPPGLFFNGVQTVVDVKPTEAAPKPEPAAPRFSRQREDAFQRQREEIAKKLMELKQKSTLVKKEEVAPAEELIAVEEPAVAKEDVEEPPKEPSIDDLVAVYESDTIPDGTVFPPNHVFEQSWVLRNAGTVAWPAGCFVKFVSGDYMGHVNQSRPAHIDQLVSASESTICYNALKPGETFAFTVLLRTPQRPGKAISYWRLTSKDGAKFGHRLWCDVSVQAEEKVESKEEPKTETSSIKSSESQMIFPKLEKESPQASIYETSSTVQPEATEVDDELDEDVDDEWADDDDDAFLTDEEYDILDASDEEYFIEQQKKLVQKK